ncbi:FAD-dependent oxidoreductase [Adlercreutzia aquisgranensis]|uniref:FAD-dependent oxidoreductase n=1 Tax=Adlercreutzia aquisgranensis TaxID=2941323 RepID=UPI00204020A5|nr:FAD-dependent oxidoreductase [Adlercreutzia aquisgranensis]
MKEISRRSFLTGAAVAGVSAAFAGTLAGCSTTQEKAPETPEEPKAPATDATTEAAAAPADPAPAPTPATDGKPAWMTAPDPVPEDEIVETTDCEILIVGAGVAGLPAAMMAAEAGADVHVLEKGGSFGVARLCTAGFNSDLQKSLGLTTDRKDFIMNTWAITNGVNGRMSSYGLWFDNSAEYINWLEAAFATKGYKLIPAASLEYKITNDGIGMAGASELWQCYPQMIYFANEDGSFFGTGNPVNWTQVMEEYSTEHGAVFHYSTPALYLERDASGRVTGVIAKNENEDYVRFNASKGVLLTTGDMAADHDMMEYYNPDLAKVVRYNINQNDSGDGQKMGIWIGAEMDTAICADMWSFSAIMMDGKLPDFLDGTHFYAGVASLPGNLMVDTTGRRIAAENLPFQAYSVPKLTCTPDGMTWSIWDSAWESKYPKDGYFVEDYCTSNTQEEVDKNVEKGLTFKFDTIEELCRHCSFDEEVFMASFNRYNELCDLGEDLDFYKDPVWMCKLDTPPFYCSKTCSSMTSTRGGLKQDERMRVLDTKGLPIPGLYAAGNTAGSFYGDVYPPNVMGSGIGHGQCFGWLAIREMLGLDYIHANI